MDLFLQKYVSELVHLSLMHSSTIQNLLGGGGGSRTRVQNTFPSASYSNNLQYIFIVDGGQVLKVSITSSRVPVA